MIDFPRLPLKLNYSIRSIPFPWLRFCSLFCKICLYTPCHFLGLGITYSIGRAYMLVPYCVVSSSLQISNYCHIRVKYKRLPKCSFRVSLLDLCSGDAGVFMFCTDSCTTLYFFCPHLILFQSDVGMRLHKANTEAKSYVFQLTAFTMDCVVNFENKQ